jgi:hypothetical protein
VTPKTWSNSENVVEFGRSELTDYIVTLLELVWDFRRCGAV